MPKKQLSTHAINPNVARRSSSRLSGLGGSQDAEKGDESFATPARSRGTRGKRPKTGPEIEESGHESDMDILSSSPKSLLKAPAEVLAEVAIPSKRGSGSSVPSRRMSARQAHPNTDTQAISTSNVSSRGTSATSSVVGDGISNYETPGTSAAPTPAENSNRNPLPGASLNTPGRSKVNTATRLQELAHSRYSLSGPSQGTKRKRVSEGEEGGNADDYITRALQEAEKLVMADYASRRPGQRVKVIVTGRNATCAPGEESAGSLPPGFVWEGNPRASSGRPNRSAGERARRSIASTSKVLSTKLIGDSEDSEAGLTELDSDEFSDAESELSALEAKEASSDDEAMEVGGDIALEANTPDQRLSTRGRRPATQTQRSRAARLRTMTRADKERMKLEVHHPDITTMWDDLEKMPVIPARQAPQPESITRMLKSFQLEGVNWMIEQEKTKWGGGLLGDEMGMGKTIQAVSLIMSDHPAKDPSMVIVPPVALMQWRNEIDEYTNGKLKVLVYHGVNAKKLTVKQLRSYDVIMTSYSTLETTYRKEVKGRVRTDDDGERILIKEDSPLHEINFHRIILDEAHNIKSRTTATAKACFALRADHKWCLSGTPLQNRIGELFSLLRFLEVTPFACYMCKRCACRELHWTMDSKTRQCTSCRHRGFDHASVFNLELLNPIAEHGNSGPGREAFGKLRILMARIMLRRLKIDHTSSMELPGKDILIRNEFFGTVERDFAASIMTNTARQFDTYVAQGVMLNNYANIFGLIMQMRQVADHPDMILRRHAEEGQNVLVCVICDEPAEDAIRSGCSHDFCRACVKSYIKSYEAESDGRQADCPRCHITLSIDLDQEEREQNEQAVKKSSIINRIKMEKWTSSTKIEMLVSELAFMRSRKRTFKSIIFSQFTSMLHLVEWRLRRAGLNTVMLDGTMSPAQRQSSIDYFMENPQAEVFLVSLKAGGVALNLTEASKVFLIDPWWNPAAEWQSADRCHRIGQGRSCNITRLVIEDSVESRMVMLQEKKANMINGTMNSDDVAMQNLTPEDMQFLFRGT
ncbi:MAG: hypothetical protein M1825_000262 [Sarcosagium campestre]|nr:MAG: hypothetical protein M1825_000262 [Sarcosagium campestre]